MTVENSDNVPALGRPRFQFGIRGLMVLAFSVAVGFSTVGTENARWYLVADGLVVPSDRAGFLLARSRAAGRSTKGVYRLVAIGRPATGPRA